MAKRSVSRRAGGVALSALLVACGGSSTTAPDDGTGTDAGGQDTSVSSGDTGDTPTDSGGSTDTGGTDAVGGSDVSADADSGGGDAGGSNTITGTADGTPFTTVATSLWIGAPDDPATTVVYVFSKPVKCSDISSPGWDTRITNATQFLEMKMFGTKVATYKVTTSKTPAAGDASVNYTLSTTTGTPAETVGNSGTVTLATITAKTNVTGNFALKFGTHDVSGTYDATFCAAGTEP
jgi:hypothetical protein